jgi:hypothetical protein
MQRLQQILDRVAKWFETQLRAGQNGFALRYVQERGLTDETISQFRLGYAPNNWDAFREAMVAQDIKIDDLMNLGLLRQSTREDKADKKPLQLLPRTRNVSRNGHKRPRHRFRRPSSGCSVCRADTDREATEIHQLG